MLVGRFEDDRFPGEAIFWPVSGLDEFEKAEAQAGERWITVHPHGDDATGIPVLLRMDPHTGHGRIIGGAGGRLQHLKLTKLRSPAEWKAQSEGRRKQRQEEARAQRAEDVKLAKQAGVKPEKITEKQRQAEGDLYQIQRERIERVAKHLGWDEKSLKLGDEQLEAVPPQRRQQVIAAHHRALHAKAQEAIKNIREGLAKSGVARAEAGMGAPDAEQKRALSLEDVLPGKSRFAHPGYQAETGERLRRAHADVVGHVHQLDAEGVRREAAGLGEAFEQGEVLPGDDPGDWEQARRRAKEKHDQFQQEVQKRLDSGDLYGARKAVADAIIRETVVKPERLEKVKERVMGAEQPELARMGREALLEAAADRRRSSELLRGVFDPATLQTDPTSFAGAVDLLKQEHQVKPKEQKLREQRAAPAAAAMQDVRPPSGAVQVKVKDVTDQEAIDKVSRDVEEKIRQDLARSLVRAAEGGLEHEFKSKAEERAHEVRTALSIGAHQALANASLTFAKHGGVAREAVDVLGVGPAAQVMAAHLRSRMSDGERRQAVEAMGRFHAAEAGRDTQGALKKAQQAYDAAKQVDLPDEVTGDDLPAAMELAERKGELLREARESVGLALGKYEALAALQFGLGQSEDKAIQVTMPDTSPDVLVRQMHALGLKPDEHYTWTHDGQHGYVELKPDAHHALIAHAPDAATMQRHKTIREIKAGEKDEPGWMPPGFARRPRQSFEQHGADLPDFSQPFPAELPADAEGALLDHVGSRVASGEPAWKILPTLNDATSGPLAAAMKAGKAAEYGKVLDKLAPTHVGRDPEVLKAAAADADRHAEDEPERWVHPEGKPVGDSWRAWKRDQEVELGRDDGSPEWRKRATDWGQLHPEPEGGGVESSEHQAWQVRGREIHRAMRRAEGRVAGPADWQAHFDAAAESYMKKNHPGHDPVHLQRLDLGDPERSGHAIEAMHRTIAAAPALKAALKSPADMTDQERRALRDWFMGEVVRKGGGEHKEKLADMRRAVEEHEKKRPQEFAEGLFGKERTAEHVEWSKKRQEMAKALGEHKGATDDASWDEYAQMVGGADRAMEVASDFARGRVSEQFAHHYERASGQKLRTSQRKVRHDDLHDIAADPSARAEHRAWAQSVGGELRRGVAGKYTSSPVKERLAKAASESERLRLAQGTMFGGASKPAGRDVKHARATLGDAMERQLAGLVDSHFQGYDPRWKPGSVNTIPDATMDGPFTPQQRIIKAAHETEKLAIGAGVGSGKTRISLGAFTQAHAQDPATRGLFAVPSAKVGGFASEAATWLEPGKYRWFNSAGRSKAERFAAYRDPDQHMVFVGHETLRDDLRDMVAKTQGWSKEQARQKILTGDDAQVDEWVRDAVHKHGAERLLDYYSIDEGHQMLNRQGKPDSLLAKISDSIIRQSKRANMMTGTMVKNDRSEMFDVLHKVDPARFPDRGDFMRRYDVPTHAAREALQREIDSYIYTSSIDPGTRPVRAEIKVPLHERQRSRVNEIEGAYREMIDHHEAARRGVAGAENRVVGAVKRMYPKAFARHPEHEHDAIAHRLVGAAGTLKEQALYDAIHGADAAENSKMQKAVELAKLYKENKPEALFDHLVKVGAKSPAEREDWMAQEGRSPHHGKTAPGVMFVRSLDAVHKLTEALKAAGLKPFAFTGKLNSQEKDAAEKAFKAGEHDVMVVSDAGAAGLNLQRGRYSVQLDTPLTHKTWEQRNGRINRVGQKESEPHQYDLVADHEFEERARERVRRKKDLHQIVHDERGSMDDTGLAAYHSRVRAEQEDRGGDPVPVPMAA